MPIQIESTTPDFLRFWEQAQNLPADQQKPLWRTLYEDRHREIFDVYYSLWGSPTRLDEALARFPQVAPSLKSVTHNLPHRVGWVISRCAGVFDVTVGEFNFVMMVGAFCANGGAAEFRGKPTSFVALEYFDKPDYVDIKIAHETAHNFHESANPAAWTPHAIAHTLFREGLASLASSVVLPGSLEAEYLWMTANHEDWLAACRARWPEIRRELLAHFDEADADIHARYFLLADQDPILPAEGLPSRAGYFAGYRALRALHDRYTVAEMTRWSPEYAAEQVHTALEAMTALD